MLRLPHHREYITCCEHIQTSIHLGLGRSLRSAAHHGESLPGAGLPVGETGCLATVEDKGYKVPDGAAVDDFISLMSFKCIVEAELLRLYDLGEVHLGLGLVDLHMPAALYFHHVAVAIRQLLPRDGSLAHDDSDSHVLDDVVLIVLSLFLRIRVVVVVGVGVRTTVPVVFLLRFHS